VTSSEAKPSRGGASSISTSLDSSGRTGLARVFVVVMGARVDADRGEALDFFLSAGSAETGSSFLIPREEEELVVLDFLDLLL
jgi:hypothetical protein